MTSAGGAEREGWVGIWLNTFRGPEKEAERAFANCKQKHHADQDSKELAPINVGDASYVVYQEDPPVARSLAICVLDGADLLEIIRARGQVLPDHGVAAATAAATEILSKI